MNYMPVLYLIITTTFLTSFFFFFNDTATTEIYTLSLHDALPICNGRRTQAFDRSAQEENAWPAAHAKELRSDGTEKRSEEHTSELQSHLNLVCRLLLEKKKRKEIAVAQCPLDSASDTDSTFTARH